MSKFRLTFLATPKQGVTPIDIGADVSSVMAESVAVVSVDASWIGGLAHVRVLFEATDHETATSASNAALHGCYSHMGIDSIRIKQVVR